MGSRVRRKNSIRKNTVSVSLPFFLVGGDEGWRRNISKRRETFIMRIAGHIFF